MIMFDINSVLLKSEKEIISNWSGNENICVSVFCQVYNHGKYIESCLVGLLMQETNFAFEIIVHDDASTDNSKKIIEKYHLLYPNIIKPIYQKENQYSRGVRPINYMLPHARGEYISICEGDDYWIYSNKLQEQVVFLNDNKDYSYHVFDSLEEVNGVLDFNSSKLNRMNIKAGCYEKLSLQNRITLLPLTSCFRNEFEFPFPLYFHKSINGDRLINLMLSIKGKGYVDASKKVAVYRIHSQGIWSKKNETYKFYELMHTSLVCSHYYNDKGYFELSNLMLFNLIKELVKKISITSILKKKIKSILNKK